MARGQATDNPVLVKRARVTGLEVISPEDADPSKPLPRAGSRNMFGTLSGRRSWGALCGALGRGELGKVQWAPSGPLWPGPLSPKVWPCEKHGFPQRTRNAFRTQRGHGSPKGPTEMKSCRREGRERREEGGGRMEEAGGRREEHCLKKMDVSAIILLSAHASG